jgi:hypothetical protein
MARARTVRLEEIDGAEPTKAETEAEELAEADDMEGGDLFAALDEMRGTAGVTFIVVRTFPSTPDMAGYVGSLTPAEFSLERMTELYGPGKYRVRVKGPKGWLPGGGTVAIAKGVASATAVPGSAGGDFAAFLRTVQERDTAAAARRDRYIEIAIPGALTLLAAVLGKNNGPDITALITAMRPAPGPSITDLVTSLSSLKSLTDTSKGDSTSQIESFLTILEKVKDLSGGEKEGASNWVDIVRDVVREGLPMARPLLENLQASQAARSMTVQPLVMPNASGVSMPRMENPAPVPPSIPPTSSNGSTPVPVVSANFIPSEANDMMAFFMPMAREQLAKIFSWAHADRSVELYSEVLLEELPAIVHQSIPPTKALEYLKHPQWFEIVTNIEPRLAEHREWCDDLRGELISIIEEQLRKDTKRAAKASNTNQSADTASDQDDSNAVDVGS